MSDLTGKTLGGYRIIEQIGLGGMATVFKAFQPSMDRYVALKVLSTHLTQDPTFVKRFKQEAKVIAKLEHLHILPVYDHGEEDGYLYLVMRFIEIGTLKDRLERGSLSLQESQRIVNQVGSALEYAHRLGVVHRDLKPSNVLIDPQGDCYLTDFGIAKMVEGTLGLTGSGVLGTPHYMAPEQSQSLKVDHRADVYAMGVVIYEMVTGRLPFDAETPFAVVMKHVTEPLPLPRSIKPDLPESVERVILKALAKDPSDRYQSMRDLVAAFDQAIEAAPVEARTVVSPSPAPPTVVGEAGPTALVPPPASVPAWRRWLFAQPLWMLAAAGLALIVLLAAGLILSRIPGRVEISGGQVQVVLPTETITPRTTPIEEAAMGATASPTTLPTATLMSTTMPAREEKSPPVTASPTPAPIGKILYSDGRTGNDEIYVANSDGSDEQRLTDRPAGDWLPAWSPDGTRIVFASDHHAIGEDRNQLYVMDADGSNLTRLTHTEGNDEHPSWSPDGSRIAFHGNGALTVIDPDGSNRTTLVEARDDLCVQRPTWSPDSQQLAFRSLTPCGDQGPYQHDIYVVNDDGSGLLKLAAFTSQERGQYVVWSPDGSQVAFDIVLDGEETYYAVNSEGDEEPVEISSIPTSWYPWYWPQWGDEAKALPVAAAAPTLTPNPMAEQSRSFVDPILAAVADRPPDYQDDFSDPAGGWDILTQDEKETGWRGGETGYADGEYFVRASPAYHPFGAERITCNGGLSSSLAEFSDLVIEVDGRFVAGERGDWQVKLRSWREQIDVSGNYGVTISADGRAKILRSENSQTVLLAEARSSTVNSGFETNHLQIIARGAQIAVLMNGELVAFATDPDPFEGGTVELAVCNFGDVPLEARWDNLRIWDISNLTTPSAEAAAVPTPTLTPSSIVSQVELRDDGTRKWCEPDTVPAGRIVLHRGLGRWPTQEEALAAMGDSWPPVTANGQPLEVKNVERSDVEWHTHGPDDPSPGWGFGASIEIQLAPGVYELSSRWLGDLKTCTLTVVEP